MNEEQTGFDENKEDEYSQRREREMLGKIEEGTYLQLKTRADAEHVE